MKIALIFSIVLMCSSFLIGQNHRQPNPFKSIGKAPKKILTLSDGKYQEFFFNDTLRRVGSVMFNTITGKIAYFIDEDSLSAEDVGRSSLVSRWLSQDPLAAKYPSMSPYNFVGNNPIIFVDPDGRDIILAKGLTAKQKLAVTTLLQKLTDDKLVYETLADGRTQIKIASLGSGKKDKGTSLIRQLNSADEEVLIAYSSEFKTGFSDNQKNNRIHFGADVPYWINLNPNQVPVLLAINDVGLLKIEKTPQELLLGHEMIHALRGVLGISIDYNELETNTYIDENGVAQEEIYPKEEYRTTGIQGTSNADITGNDLRREQGSTYMRQSYGTLDQNNYKIPQRKAEKTNTTKSQRKQQSGSKPAKRQSEKASF